MANLNIKVTDVLSKFYNVTEDESIKGLYEIRDKEKPDALLWYVFSSNNATYHATKPKIGKNGQELKAAKPTMAIRDINQSNSGYIDRLIKAYKKASKENKKIFWLVLVYGEGNGLNAEDREWMASVELLTDVESITASLTMRTFPIGKNLEGAWEPKCVRVEQDKYFNTTFISCKDSNGEFTDEYMKYYFESYDNRPWSGRYEGDEIEEDVLDLGYLPYLDNPDFADQTIDLMIQYELFDEDVLNNMLDPEWSKTYIKRILPMLRKVPEGLTKEEFDKLRKDDKGTNNRYYDVKHKILGDEYIISNNWCEDEKNGFKKTEFTEYIAELLNENGINAIVSKKVVGAENVLIYGVPGSGKSHYIKKNYKSDKGCLERVVFHPDYSYADFVGQIMPRVEDDEVVYKYVAGPFTKILCKAWNNPNKKFFLIIEEINRGNAPAIFGEIFQLLDRNNSGESEYGITNYDIANELYENDPEHEIKIPSNLWILATMNTSDQNVFTLDTAFQRRWKMKQITNKFEDDHEFADTPIMDTSITWKVFNETINDIIITKNPMSSTEDKRLGAYFIKAQDLSSESTAFPEKVIKYLWDDAVKFSRDTIFRDKAYPSLELVIEKFEKSSSDERFKVFKEGIFKLVKESEQNKAEAEKHENEEEQ